MREKRIIKNIGYGISTKFLVMSLNFIIPRIFIVSYGSEVNGLLATITQIFSYLALLEAGIGNASVNALYKPLDQKNYEQVNQVVGESITYYRKVTRYYALGVAVFALIYPLISGATLDRKMIFMIIFLQGFANCVSYYFSAAYIQFLIAAGKNYLVEGISGLISIGTALTKIILIACGFDVVSVQFGHLLIVLCKIPMVYFVCIKRYPWLKPIKAIRYDSIKERSAFVVHEVSSTIFSNTDIFIISTVCGFALSSVYSIYNMVFSALSTIINTANAGLGFLLGQNYYKDRERFLKIYDCYSTLYTMVIFIIMTVAYILIFPFVRLYISNVADIDYIIPGLPLLFAIINIMSGSRAVAARLIVVTGHAKETQNRSILETLINLLTSVVLVNWIGIHGVLIGTIIALFYRMNDIIIYANRIILKRSPWLEYKGILVNAVVFLVIAYIFNEVLPQADGFIELICLAVLVTITVMLIYGVVTIMAHRENVRSWICIFKES